VTTSIRIVKASARDNVAVFSLVYPLLIELYPNEPTYTPENISASTEQLLENHPDYFGFIATVDFYLHNGFELVGPRLYQTL
jgi:hypothetical protein